MDQLRNEGGVGWLASLLLAVAVTLMATIAG
jgi:hypothetical protein